MSRTARREGPLAAQLAPRILHRACMRRAVASCRRGPRSSSARRFRAETPRRRDTAKPAAQTDKPPPSQGEGEGQSRSKDEAVRKPKKAKAEPKRQGQKPDPKARLKPSPTPKRTKTRRRRKSRRRKSRAPSHASSPRQGRRRARPPVAAALQPPLPKDGGAAPPSIPPPPRRSTAGDAGTGEHHRHRRRDRRLRRQARASNWCATASRPTPTRSRGTSPIPLAKKLVEWVILRSDDSGADFARYVAFISANPSWPSIVTLRRKAEAAPSRSKPPDAQCRPFSRSIRRCPPRAALRSPARCCASGNRKDAEALVREAWRYDSFSQDVESRVRRDLRRHASPTPTTRRAWIARLYEKDDTEAGLRAAARLGGNEPVIAKARIAMLNKGGKPRPRSTPCRPPPATTSATSSPASRCCAAPTSSPKRWR